MKTIFDHRVPPVHIWVNVRVPIYSHPRRPPKVYDLAVRVTYPETERGIDRNSIEITDFRAPSHPEVDWKWIDSHIQDIFHHLEFNP